MVSEVIIDGQKYIPAPPPAEDSKWLDVRFYDYISLDREVSIREFFHELMQKLWDEQDGFSGKRPFGNSCWEFPVIYALIEAGAIPGTVTYDEDGYVEESHFDRKVAHEFVRGLISQMFYGDK